MKRDPLRIACWRFEQISPLLDPRHTASERHRLAKAIAGVCVVWPSGREAPISVSTLYRWLRSYQRDPRIESLMPSSRTTKRSSMAIPKEWLHYALALLEEEPTRSLYILSCKIQDHFHLSQRPARSSLHRALQRQPRYWKLRKRARGSGRLRRRFQAREPHQIWHTDAKAAFSVHYADGSKKKVRVHSILDDCTRYVLRALIVTTESTATAVATFRQAAARWGLPHQLYADRGSPYDSDVFRKGLAILGVRRIRTRSRNAPAHGKIEAYHRVMDRWFITELRHQLVLDDAHLQELLDAFIELRYHAHTHRELKMTPREAFTNRLSKRLVSLDRLREAFLIEKVLTIDKKDGTIRVKGSLFRVPRQFPAQREVRIAVDPEEPHMPYLLLKPGRLVPLKPAVHEAGAHTQLSAPAGRVEPVGSLTPLLEKYRGRTLPLARPGFGLPEIYQAFSHALGRQVPSTEAEASFIVEWLSQRGPFDATTFQLALDRPVQQMGAGRPLAQIITALDRKLYRILGKENA